MVGWDRNKGSQRERAATGHERTGQRNATHVQIKYLVLVLRAGTKPTDGRETGVSFFQRGGEMFPEAQTHKQTTGSPSTPAVQNYPKVDWIASFQSTSVYALWARV